MATVVDASLRESAWGALSAHYEKIRGQHMRELFAQDPKRAEKFSVEGAGVFLDYSKNRVTDETLKLLVELADAVGLARKDRRHVPRREDQRLREARRAARRAARAEGRHR